MSFVYGTTLMVLAIVLLGFAKYVVTRFETSSWISRFAGTETMALMITMITAFGIAFLAAGIASDTGALGLTELGASLGVIALAIVGVVRVFRIADRKDKLASAATSPAQGGSSPAVRRAA